MHLLLLSTFFFSLHSKAAIGSWIRDTNDRDPRWSAGYCIPTSLMPIGTNICSFNDGRRCTFKIQKCNTGQIHYSRRIRPLLSLHIYDGIYCGARSLACLGQFITIWYWPEEVVANEKVVWLQTPPLEGFEYSTLLVDYATFNVINKSMWWIAMQPWDLRNLLLSLDGSISVGIDCLYICTFCSSSASRI